MAWQLGLLNSMKDPSAVMIKSNLAVVIKDKFPKAKHHFLVLPLEDIPSIFKLNKNQIDLLLEMELLATNVIEVIGEKVDQFRIGYHAQPSMKHLHLHVISKDFSSPFLKTKKHFNSFNTEFFIDAHRIRSELEEDGRLSQWNEAKLKALLAQDLKCCGKTFTNMPKLKKHLEEKGHIAAS